MANAIGYERLNAMFTKMDETAEKLLCCPNCKAALQANREGATCVECGEAFGKREFQTGAGAESVLDFRITPPSYCMTASMREWHEGQVEFESLAEQWAQSDLLTDYEAEANGVRSLYEWAPLTG